MFGQPNSVAGFFERKNRRMEEMKIKKGSLVKMNDKYRVSDANKEKTFEVITDPQMVCGTLCVWLDGYRGCYAVDGLDLA